MSPQKHGLFLLLILLFQVNISFVNASYNLRKLDNKDGLSNSAVLYIHQDHNGFMWFGTYDGLNMYDGKNIQVYRLEFGDKHSLSSNIIQRIADADNDCLWISTYLGVNKFSLRQRKVVETYTQYRDSCRMASNKEGLTWLVGKRNYLSYYDTDTHCFRELPLKGISPGDIETLFLDENKVLWIFTSKNKIWNITSNYPQEKDFKKVRLHVQNAFIHNVAIQDVFYGNGFIHFVDIHGMLFVYDIARKKKSFIRDMNPLIRKYGAISSIVSYHYDVLVAFKGNGTIKLVANKQYQEEIIEMNTGVFYMYKDDNQDVVWIGSDGQGALMYYKDQEMFGSIMLNWLPLRVTKPVRSIYTDKYNNLWFGTKGDGVIRVRDYDKVPKDRIPLANISHYTTESGLSNNQVYALVGSRFKNILWMASDGPGLSYFSYADNKVHSVINKTRVSINYVHSLYEENDTTLWMATAGKGLLKVVIQGNSPSIRVRSIRYFVFQKGPSVSNEFFSMANDGKSTIWVGSRGGYGVIRFDTKTNKYKFISLNDENVSAINDILCVYLSNDSTFYFGSSSGLTKMQFYSDGRSYLKNVNGRNGFLNDMIHGILEDDNGCIWLSTNKGLIKYNPQNNFSHNYYYREGLTVVEFSDDAYYHCPYTGRLFFGGINGLSWVEPGVIDHTGFSPKVFFTGLRISGEKKNIYDYLVGDDKHLELPAKVNSFAVSFVALDYINGPNFEYSYFLENYSTEWTDSHSLNEATFTDLPSGHYVLKVKYKSDVFDSETKYYTLPITILYPWYLTTVARIIYSILFILLCSYIILLIMRKIKEKRQDLVHKLQEQKKEELYDAKLKFFTNITHEFCTPLTLIHGICERILSYNKSDAYIQKYATVLLNNAKHLNKLIQEIIDFRKIEEAGFGLSHIEKVSISELVADQVMSFTEAAERSNITFEVKVPDELYWNTDISCMNKILINLISNAFKYTPEGGNIKVTISVEGETLKVLVYNTGKGIEKEKLGLIFDRYRILDNMDKNAYRDIASRNGLGLAICYSMVQLLHGQIEVKSEIDKYTEFLVDFPLLPITDSLSQSLVKQDEVLSNSDTINVQIEKEDEQFSLKPAILVIDDNKDIVWLVSDILSTDYRVLKAYDAKEALDILEKQTPVLIITDIMMPGTDGFDLTKQIRANKYTCTIPLIIISARNTEEDQVKGLANGADAYLTKPFSSSILRGLVDRLVSNKQVLKTYYNSPESAYELSDGQWMHQDDKDFLESVMKIVKENIDKESLGPELVAEEMGLNTRRFYRKFKEVSQLSPSDFIKDYRFSYAAKLLVSTNISIQEVIYKVGIMNRSYFYREFSKKFNMTPREYRLLKKEDSNN